MATAPAGSRELIARDPLGFTQVLSTDWLMEVGFGTVPGYTRVAALGNNPDVGSGTVPEDIWSYGGTFNFITTPAALEAVSTSTSDAAAGVGMRTFSISGLDSNYNVVTETVTLNGTTPVALSNQFFRFNLLRNVTSGTTGLNVGDITIRDVSGGTVRAHIPAGYGISRQALFTVPTGRTMQVHSMLGTTAKNNGGVLRYWTRALMQRASNGSMVAPLEIGFDDVPYRHDGIPGIVVNEKTDFWMRVNQASTSGMNITGGFLAVLKRTD